MAETPTSRSLSSSSTMSAGRFPSLSGICIRQAAGQNPDRATAEQVPHTKVTPPTHRDGDRANCHRTCRKGMKKHAQQLGELDRGPTVVDAPWRISTETISIDWFAAASWMGRVPSGEGMFTSASYLSSSCAIGT